MLSDQTLPIINLGALDAPAETIDATFRTLGFMQLTNFGVSPDLLEKVFAASDDFFAAPETFKREFTYRSAEENFGYQALLTENLNPNAPPDVKETFTMRNIVAAPIEDTRWPSLEFKTLMTQLFSETLAAAHGVQREIASALGVAPDFFARAHTGKSCSLRLLYYPRIQAGQLSDEQLGAGAHTDYGFMTFLFQRNVGGLEVVDSSGNWIAVPPVADAAVVNCGDLLERWTNGAYRSTLHRVRTQVGAPARLSIAMFIDPDPETPVAVLPECISATHPMRYAPTTAGEHLQEKLAATHKGRYQS